MTQLWSKLTRSFHRAPLAAPKGAIAPQRAPRQARRTGQLDQSSFVQVVTNLFQYDGNTRLHVVSLADFRQLAGGKWDRLHSLVEIAADAIVAKHINLDRDIFTRIDAETSCLALPRSSPAEAQSCVAAIAQDLAAHLFGATIFDGRQPRVVSAHLPVRGAVDGNGKLDEAALQQAVAQAVAQALSPPHRDTLTALLAPETKPAPLAEPSWLPLPSARRAEPTEAPAWLESQLEENARLAQAAVGAGATAMAPDTSLRLAWVPVWVTGRQAISAFQAQVIRLDSGTATTSATAMKGVHAYAGVAPMEALTLDRFVATQSARELKNLFIKQQRNGLAIPLHWMSLAPRWRDCIRIPFEDCPPAARRKLLKIEIFGLTPDIPTHILQTLFEPLEKLNCDVMARLPLGAMDMIPALRGVKAVGVDLAEL
ncbi:MAG: hypothetical protein K2X44_04255, partial [Magnetospirillum sp.]|nr:hypothetical protein [Magnetospirillum sp.]